MIVYSMWLNVESKFVMNTEFVCVYSVCKLERIEEDIA